MSVDGLDRPGKRSDTFHVWKDIDNELYVNGNNEIDRGIVIGLGNGWFAKIARPTCIECGSKHVYLDDHSMPVCRACDCINISSYPNPENMVSDARAAQRYDN